MAKQEPERFLSMREACALLGISERQLRRLMLPERENGQTQIPLPHHRVGARLRFLASELKAWVSSNRGAA